MRGKSVLIVMLFFSAIFSGCFGNVDDVEIDAVLVVPEDMNSKTAIRGRLYDQ